MKRHVITCSLVTAFLCMVPQVRAQTLPHVDHDARLELAAFDRADHKAKGMDTLPAIRFASEGIVVDNALVDVHGEDTVEHDVSGDMPKVVGTPRSLSGHWYDPGTAGQGIELVLAPTGNHVVFTWYTHHRGQQVWLYGEGQRDGRTLNITVIRPNGANFPPDMRPSDVVNREWGTVRISFNHCNELEMQWTPNATGHWDGFRSGSATLYSLLRVDSGDCGLPPVGGDDDHGHFCHTATNLAGSNTIAGRLDASGDVDMFRVNIAQPGVYNFNGSNTQVVIAVLNANCEVVGGGRLPFAAALGAGTQYFRVSSPEGHFAHYSATFTLAGGGPDPSTNVTLSLKNDLIYDVMFNVEGVGGLLVGSGSSREEPVRLPQGNLIASFNLVGAQTNQGAPVGTLQGGTYATIFNASGRVNYVFNRTMGGNDYFAPVVTNNTGNSYLMAVSLGLQSENRCNCVIAPGQTARMGYYRLYSNSTVHGFRESTGYSGNPAITWSGLIPYWQPESGRVNLSASN